MTLASEDDRRAFVARFGPLAFPHAVAVMALFEGKDSEVTIDVSTVARLRELRSAYRVRADILAWRAPTEAYPASLPDDVRALADALEAAEDQPVRIWNLQLPSAKCFIVFELLEAGHIAGVVESVSQRVLTQLR